MFVMTCRASRNQNCDELLVIVMDAIMATEGFIDQFTKGASTNGAKPHFNFGTCWVDRDRCLVRLPTGEIRR